MTNPLWTVAEFVRHTGGAADGPIPDITGISIDTRTLAPGDAFFALSDIRDGHDFAAAALAKGASVAVIRKDKRAALGPGRYVLVDDVLEALTKLGLAARARSKAAIIAVTGSVGKTGTKEMLRLACGALGETHASVASYNNHWGVPLTLARMPESARYGVFEIGMNHAGEIEPLSRMVRPQVALITTIEPVHIEYLGSIEAIADAKAEIFAGLGAGGAAVVNADNPQGPRLVAAAEAAGVSRIVTFGSGANCDARLIGMNENAEGSVVEADILGERLAFRIGAPGRHLVMNAIGALASVVLAGGDLAVAALALGRFAAPKGRGARLKLVVGQREATLIDESYNANPASMRAAFALLAASPVGRQGRRIAVIGDMLELGPEGPAMHRDLAGAVEDNKIDLVYAAGPLMKGLYDALKPERRGHYAATSAELQRAVLDAIHAEDVVMVKGSLGSRMGPIVEALKARFSIDTAA